MSWSTRVLTRRFASTGSATAPLGLNPLADQVAHDQGLVSGIEQEHQIGP